MTISPAPLLTLLLSAALTVSAADQPAAKTPSAPAVPARPAVKPDPAATADAQAVKSKSRFIVTPDQTKQSREEKGKRSSNGGMNKEIKTRSAFVLKIRNMTEDKVTYRVEYIFAAQNFNGGSSGELALLEQNAHELECEPGTTGELRVSSKLAHLTEARSSAASYKTKRGQEADGYLILVRIGSEEIYAYNSKSNDRYEKAIRNLIQAKKQPPAKP